MNTLRKRLRGKEPTGLERARIAPKLLGWYEKNRRELPWRSPRQSAGCAVDPFHVLVSEFMLQQTQVATVVPYFQRFMVRFPTIRSLATANEQDVLRLWQGLGYYSRARNLLVAARKICGDFGGEIPRTVQELQSLPGIGRYTAGAIASIGFGTRAPIVDGNVARVLCRLSAITDSPKERNVQLRLWNLAERLIPNQRVGDFNSALMELGATVCTPRSPNCPACPLAKQCKALARGIAESIPPAKVRRQNPIEHRWTVCIERGGKWLIEQRPARGRWAGMWQFVTLPAANGKPAQRLVAQSVGCRLTPLRSLGQIQHALTHRQYRFDVFTANAKSNGAAVADNRRWVALAELSNFPLPRPHLKIAQMLVG